MAADKVHIRHCMLFEYNKGNNARMACRNICDVYGTDAVNVRTCQRWFSRFHAGDTSLAEKPRSGRPSEINDDHLRALVEADPCQTSREIADKMEVDHSNIVRHLRQLGVMSSYDVWVPQELSQKILMDRVAARLPNRTMSSYVGQDVACNYAKFRPQPPESLIDSILKAMHTEAMQEDPKFGIAVDIGCGSGQMTTLLAPYFGKIYGFDTSEDQLKIAQLYNEHDHITYTTGTASSIPLASQSVDLIIASQAAHWFDLDAFFKEAARVLKPRGMIALTGYVHPEPQYEEHSQELFTLVENFFAENRYLWHTNNKILLNRYRDLERNHPHATRIDPLPVDIECTLTFLLEHIKSRSGIQKLIESQPVKADQIILDFQHKFLKIIGSQSSPDHVNLVVRFNYFLLLWQNSKLNV